jgi:RNA polymerase sigma-70 factor (ECF subfamily)
MTFFQMKGLSDEDLMEHLKSGYQDALAVLFLRYNRLVLSIALRTLRDRGEAEDITQEVFIEILRKAANFDPSRGSARIWILQYAYYKSHARWQYLNLRRFYDNNSISRLDVLEPYYYPDVWRDMDQEDWAYIIKQGLETLNEKQRKTLELLYFHDLTLKEIAERTKESYANVRHYYYRGLKKLRDFMKDQPLFEEQLVRSHAEAIDVEP